jgi:hypothetical protein
MNFVFSISKPGGICRLVDGDGVLLSNLAFLSFLIFFNQTSGTEFLPKLHG